MPPETLLTFSVRPCFDCLQQLLFHVDPQGILHSKRTWYSWVIPETGEYQEPEPETTELESVKLPIGDSRELGGCSTRNGAVIFFENITGNMQGISLSGGKWTLMEPIACGRQEGSPFGVLRVSDEMVVVFCWHTDKGLHQMTVELQNNVYSGKLNIHSEEGILFCFLL